TTTAAANSAAADRAVTDGVAVDEVAPEETPIGKVVAEETTAYTVAADAVAAEAVLAQDVAAEAVATDESAVDEDAAVDEAAAEPEPDLIDGVGYVAGLGIISGAHVRDLAHDPDTLVRPLGDGTDTPLPATQPADPYRPSAALDTYIRARDRYCTWPGCSKPAWDGDLDHITEYDHAHPERGGRTSATGLGAKCRFHHLLKTFGDFVDDQYDDPDHPGRIIRTVTIPEGRTVLGPAYTGFDTHPGLDMIVFGDPPATGSLTSPTPRTPAPDGTEPTRPA
ncbi:HNH endonuclease signature motif containing protein, partial [Rhodococcoides kroppenstedtii]|uniref:HNH endonuclease signature motif containing protein n=1 Tax=Rhodococcoides kroppenstedtii TaxID=293050 RepID=UPI001470DB79